MLFLDGMRGENHMEGNLDNTVRTDDISDEVGLDVHQPEDEENEDDCDHVDNDLENSPETPPLHENSENGDGASKRISAMDWCSQWTVKEKTP